MNINHKERREFIKLLMASGVVLSTPWLRSCAQVNKRLNILVLGGTYFVGPSIVSAATSNNHKVTLFNRGITNPALFPDVELIRGDRHDDPKAYESLKEKNWDVVIDVWPEHVNLVDEATRELEGYTKHYIFIYSIAVYKDFQEVGLNEESEVVTLIPDKNEWSYPEEKLAADRLIEKRFPGRNTILRPGPIKGWRDPALDLLYWCIKLNRDSAILAPGSGEDPLQFIDVKDVGRFAIMAAEKNFTGVYNCTGPQAESLLWKDFLSLCQNHFDSKTRLYWANEAFLSENEVYSFSDLPLWAPLSEDKGFMQMSNRKLVGSGFEYTPVTATLTDCMRWFESNIKSDIKFGSSETDIGLDRFKEVALIKKLQVASIN